MKERVREFALIDNNKSILKKNLLNRIRKNIDNIFFDQLMWHWRFQISDRRSVRSVFSIIPCFKTFRILSCSRLYLWVKYCSPCDLIWLFCFLANNFANINLKPFWPEKNWLTFCQNKFLMFFSRNWFRCFPIAVESSFPSSCTEMGPIHLGDLGDNSIKMFRPLNAIIVL